MHRDQIHGAATADPGLLQVAAKAVRGRSVRDGDGQEALDPQDDVRVLAVADVLQEVRGDPGVGRPRLDGEPLAAILPYARGDDDRLADVAGRVNLGDFTYTAGGLHHWP